MKHFLNILWDGFGAVISTTQLDQSKTAETMLPTCLTTSTAANTYFDTYHSIFQFLASQQQLQQHECKSVQCNQMQPSNEHNLCHQNVGCKEYELRQEDRMRIGKKEVIHSSGEIRSKDGTLSHSNQPTYHQTGTKLQNTSAFHEQSINMSQIKNQQGMHLLQYEQQSQQQQQQQQHGSLKQTALPTQLASPLFRLPDYLDAATAFSLMRSFIQPPRADSVLSPLSFEQNSLNAFLSGAQSGCKNRPIVSHVSPIEQVPSPFIATQIHGLHAWPRSVLPSTSQQKSTIFPSTGLSSVDNTKSRIESCPICQGPGRRTKER